MNRNDPDKYTKKNGFGVAPSPLNHVKLELGIFLSLAILVWFAIHYVTNNTEIQLLLLVVFSFSVTCRLVYKTHRVVKQIHEKPASTIQKATKN